jgi:hypothetical protein
MAIMEWLSGLDDFLAPAASENADRRWRACVREPPEARLSAPSELVLTYPTSTLSRTPRAGLKSTLQPPCHLAPGAPDRFKTEGI